MHKKFKVLKTKEGLFSANAHFLAILGISSKKMLRFLLTRTYVGEYSLHRWRVH